MTDLLWWIIAALAFKVIAWVFLRKTFRDWKEKPIVKWWLFP